LPKWGIFMSKVYADSKLDYGKIKTFPIPANLKNEELSAEAWEQIMNQSDSVGTDAGNGPPEDYFVPSTPAENIKIESDIPKADTGKSKKPEPKKGTNTPAATTADDKNKKPAAKPGKTNDY
ncbi:MAG TPA: hypothetical protein PLG91_11415, partial [Ferruginibacter sp.]|nr:hypothetical protein [Ferruginibacter sp.]